MDKIRNFCIIAHIDHGKSTLADRMMEITGTVEKRDMKSQLLDSMELEKERGITIKLAPVRMKWKASDSDSDSDASRLNRLSESNFGATREDGERVSDETRDDGLEERRQNSESGSRFNNLSYDLNLIDTPGHVDFSYEVSRSLAACEGAVLVVDASQGIQAQTLANVYLALEADLAIIPVLNKIDLPAADVEKTTREIVNLLGCHEDDILKISAKTGAGVAAVLDAVIAQVPPPSGHPHAKTRALIFDSYYDDYRGVILYVRVVDGEISSGDAIKMLATAAHGLALEVGHLSPKMTPDPTLATGEIGYIVTNLKTTRDARVGDTVTLKKYFAKDN